FGRLYAGSFVFVFALAMLYAAWRSALRSRRPHVTMPVLPPSTAAARLDPAGRAPRAALSRRRLAASFALAFIVTFVSWVGGFALAESGAWGGEHGILYWCVVSPGLGLSFAAFRLGLRVPAGMIASSP